MLCPATSSKSIFHWLARQREPGGDPPERIRAYLAILAVTYLPLLVTVLVDARPEALWNGFKGGSVPFFEDLGFNYALLVSLPSLVVLLVSDEYLLFTALDEVRKDQVVRLSPGSLETLKQRWAEIFEKLNLIAQLGGILLAIPLAIATAQLYKQNVNSWIANDHKLNSAGYLYVYCVALFYVVIIFYVARSVAISVFLRAVVKTAESPLSILPLHPDKCGGLRPVGRLGLRNQYTLTILGINLLLLLVVWYRDMDREASFGKILMAGCAAYVILGPIIFMAPLLPFREAMRTAKKKWTHEFAALVRSEIDQLHKKITANDASEIDEKSIERLRKVGAALDELPIWPFDPATLRKFATAYFVPPVLLPLLGKSVQLLLRLIGFG